MNQLVTLAVLAFIAILACQGDAAQPVTPTAVPAATSAPTVALAVIPAPANTSMPTTTSYPESTPTPPAAATAIPALKATQVWTPTPGPTETPAPTATPTPQSEPARNTAEVLQDGRLLMLKLVNEARAKEGSPPVELGYDATAQAHAEASLEGCFGSHWDTRGLKPYMRYSLGGGTRITVENALAMNYCRSEGDGPPLDSIEDEVLAMMASWLSSPDHAAVILFPSFTRLNVGLAWDPYNVRMYQLFET